MTDPQIATLQMASPPQQDRSRDTLRRILAAAEDLFARKGLQGATVPEICRQAGSSTGAFYARFRDKDELLSVLFADLVEAFRTGVGGALTSEAAEVESLNDLVTSVVSALAAIFRTRTGLFRVFAAQGNARGEFLEASNILYAELSAQVLQALLRRRAAFTHPDPVIASAFVTAMAVAVLEQKALSTRAAGDDQTDWVMLEQETVRAALGYLGALPEGRRP